MLTKKFIRGLTFTTAIVSVSTSNFAEAKDETSSPEQISAIETIVRNLIEREPTLIENALRAAMEKREKDAEEHAKKMVKKHHDEIFNSKNDPFVGNPKAPVTLAVFMDPYCGYCRHLQANLKEVLKERNDVKIVYKAYPILTKESKLAAEEELAAHEMGKFEDFHTALYASDARDRKSRLQLAKENKINVEELKKHLPKTENNNKDKIDQQLDANMKLGKKLGIQGTPAIIAGDNVISGALEKDQLNQLIDIMKKENNKA